MSVGHYSQTLKREPRRVVSNRSVIHNGIKTAAQAYLHIDSQLRIMPETASGTRYDQLITQRDQQARLLAAAIAKLGA